MSRSALPILIFVSLTSFLAAITVAVFLDHVNAALALSTAGISTGAGGLWIRLGTVTDAWRRGYRAGAEDAEQPPAPARSLR